MRRRRGRKRATGSRAPLLLPALPNARWSIDRLFYTRIRGPEVASGRNARGS